MAMTKDRRKFTRESPEQRKLALIEATLELVAENGVRGATVRGIAERAEVTQGLIRHYFSTKEDLVQAAYDFHMTRMTDETFAGSEGVQGSAIHHLAAFVRSSLTPPVVDSRSLALWAAFLNKVQHDVGMRETHAKTYLDFRCRLQSLIEAALEEAGQEVSQAQLLQYAIASNALIDGLWMEGGALPEAFEPGELVEIGLSSIGAILGLDLKQAAGAVPPPT
ncbi:transcriptional regulator, TetR family protein [Roseobacter sp. SK209-2-6]|nr:transcriptional regulator, TetR family protein [Roseobacter sp. SK209-2-6]